MDVGKEEQHINSIIRTINILNLYKNGQTYLGITEISKLLKLHKTTVFRIVKTLENEGWLIKNEVTNQYKLGLAILDVASSVSRIYSSRDIILEEMNCLSMEFNENVILNIYSNLSAVCIERIEAQNKVKIASEIGSRTPLYCGASSKIILAYQDREIIENVIKNGLIKFTENTIIHGDELIEDLSKIKNQGYSISFEEIDEGVACIAVPIINNKDEILYGLSIVAPINRIELKGVEKIKNRLLKASSNITNKIKLLQN